MTSIYNISKWDDPEFLIALHEVTTAETNPIKFESVVDDQHSRVYDLALTDVMEDYSRKLFVTSSNPFNYLDRVGGFNINLLKGFQSKLVDFGDTFVNLDIEEDIRETVSFSVFETNAFHKLPGGFKCRMKKADDEMMD
jgi:hypothetical protein